MRSIVKFWTILLGIFLSIGIVFAFALAKTGFIHVPFFSRWYQPPTPTRVVESPVITQAQFVNMIQSRVLSQASAGMKPPYRVEVTEQEISGAFQDAAQKMLHNSAWTIESSQVAIRSTDLEFVLHLKHSFISVDALIRVAPHVKGDTLYFDPTFVQVGDYLLPPTLAQQFASVIFSRDLGTWKLAFGTAVLSAVNLTEGKLEVIL